MAYDPGDMLAKLTIESKDAINRDQVTMDFVFKTADNHASTNADAAFVSALLMEFLNTTPAGAVDPVAAFLSPELDRGANKVHVKVYRIVVGIMGPPFYMHDDSLGLSGGTALPSEVAVALSYHADLTGLSEELPDTTRPAARRRGRVYVGPVGTNALTVDGTTSQARVSAGCQTTLTKAAKVLHDHAAADGLAWAQWSRKGQVLRPVVGCHVDNAFDTQRRRGPRATARTALAF